MSTPAIRLEQVHKSFGTRAVLRGIDFVVAPGELLGLIGPNGAGKSTLLRTLIGLLTADAGRVSVLDLDPRRDSLLVRRRCCYLPGETGVYQQLTGRQFLDFALGFYPRHDAARREHLLEVFALPLTDKVRSYSAGMKQKLALLATLVPDVELYLLDEPDRALDASVRFALRAVLLAMQQQGKTIVLSSHHLGEVEALADRLEFLLDGTFVAADRLARARAKLRQRPRVRLREGGQLPAGARLVQRESDDTMVIETTGDPMQWLRDTPPGAVESAEVGIPRLEDLYQLLLQAEQDGGA
ncbi:MAG: ABC transporter ATP-binding protein [Planctomycetes bacterium]|jgi:ABC-2 type transport system ATP-binding protein|nr:ABC transporter ATP-binding protein [Planctomycetota bacterium]